MNNSSINDLEQIAKNIISESGFEICNFEINDREKPLKIEIKIQKKGGSDVNLNDCAYLNNPIKNAFFNSKILESHYVLEISSKGLNEFLTTEKDFKTFRGFPVEVTSDQNSNKPKKFQGLLHEKSIDYLSINIKGKIRKIPIEVIDQVKLIAIQE